MHVIISTVKNPSVFTSITRVCFLWLALGAVSVLAADVTVVPVFTGWRDAASFKRISEYFNGKENTGGQFILRTHPDERSGFYFLMRIHHSGAALKASAELQVITPDAATPRIFKFTTTLTDGKTMLNLGLTGPDWPDLKVNPVAWKLDLLTADGQLLATENSYLWEKPVTK